MADQKEQTSKELQHSHLSRFIVTQVPIIEKTKTLRSLISQLKQSSRSLKETHSIYVVDKKGELVGMLTMEDVFKHKESVVIETIMQEKIISASPKTDIEKIAHLALKHGIGSVPIVENGKLIGVIPSKNISSILNTSLRKDLFHFAGIHHSHLDYENSLTVPLTTSMIHRLPWLVIGIIGIIAVAVFMGGFEKILQKYLILAFFVPAVVYASDSLGTQVQAILIRDLAIIGEELDMKKYFFRQMSITIFISLIVSIMFMLAISLLWKQPYMALVISSAVLTSLVITSFSAFIITILIKKFGFDPALGAGPFVTIVSDATSIIVYFVVATLML